MSDDQLLRSSVTGLISQYKERAIAVKTNATPPPHTLDQKLSEGSQYSIESNAVNKIWPIWEIGVSTVAVGATRQQFNSVQQEGEICDGAIS